MGRLALSVEEARRGGQRATRPSAKAQLYGGAALDAEHMLPVFPNHPDRDRVAANHVGKLGLEQDLLEPENLS